MPDNELSTRLSAVGDAIDSEITKAVEKQGRELSGKIEAQGRELSGKIEAHAQRTQRVETQLASLDTNVSSLNRTFDRQQTVIWALVALLGATVLGVLALVIMIAASLIQESREMPSAAQVPSAVVEGDSSQPTAQLPDESESAESTIVTP